MVGPPTPPPQPTLPLTNKALLKGHDEIHLKIVVLTNPTKKIPLSYRLVHF